MAVSSSALSRINGVWGPLQNGDRPTSARDRSALIAVLLLAFALRMGVAWLLPNINHADEVYQVAEQATRWAHGYGIEPWEFRTSSRTVLLPTLVTPIYELNVPAASHRLLQDGLFCALSLLPVLVAFRWGARLFGLPGGVLSGAVMALWFELVYLAPKATADAVAGYLLLGGLFMGRPHASRFAALLSGSTLVLAMALRVQILPAAALALALCWLTADRERRIALAAGIAVAMIVAGAVEWRWWGAPFQGQIGYVTMELTHHSSRFFAQEPVTFYLKQYVLLYGAALPIVAILILQGARRAPVLLIVAMAVVVPFHFVGHKEYRFVIAALPMLVLLMGLATSDLLGRLDPDYTWRTLSLTIGAWLVAMMAVSWGDTFRPFWMRDGNHIRAFEDVAEQADACGIALQGIRWWHTPGYSGLGRNIPIYEMRGSEDTPRVLDAANYVMQAPKSPAPPAPFEKWRDPRARCSMPTAAPAAARPPPRSRWSLREAFRESTRRPADP